MTNGCEKDALGRSLCAAFLRDQFIALGTNSSVGCEVTVSTLPPLVESGYGEHCFTCPHGVVYWIEPTSDQILDWAQKRIP